jgi:hypothetical protein
MSLSNLAPIAGVAAAVDSVGPTRGPVDSGVYSGVISSAYLKTSSGGALAVVLEHKADSGKTVKQDVYITSGNAKGNKTTYTKKDKSVHYLPGYTLINNLCLMVAGKNISELESTKKLTGVYIFDLSKEVDTEVDMLMDLVGQKVDVGIIKLIEDKNKNVAAEGEPKDYQPTGETRTSNEIDCVFHSESKLTVPEAVAGITEAIFIDTWKARWDGEVKDNSTGAKGSGSAATGGAAATAAPATSLFAKPTAVAA